MNLFKRFCAVITIIAIIASFGVTAFAVETPAVEITEVTTALKSAGVYTVTITYDATAVGDMGVTMLSYLSATGSLEEGETFDQGSEPAAPTMYVAGIDQWTVENGTGLTKSFDVKVGTPGTGSVAYGATNLVMMGGDGVEGADMFTYAIQWDATALAAAGTLALTDVPYGSDETAIAALVEAELGDSITLTYTGADSKTAELVDYDAVDVVVEENNGAYTVEFTTTAVNAVDNVAKLPESVDTLTTGAQALSVAFAPFAADEAVMKGDTQAITVGLAEVEGAVEAGSSPNLLLTGADLANKIAKNVAAKVTAKGIVLKSTTNDEWRQEVTAADLEAASLSLTAVYTSGTTHTSDNFTTVDVGLEYTITVSAITDSAVTVGNATLADPVTFDVAVTVKKYVAEWNVAAASYVGTAIDNEYDMPTADLTDAYREEKAFSAVESAVITLTGADEGYTQEVLVSELEGEVLKTLKTVEENYFVTVTIPGGTYNNAVVAEPGLTVDIPVKFTENPAEFTFDSVTYKKGATDAAATALDVTVSESTADAIAAAIAADYKAYVTLKRGEWKDNEETELALDAEWIAVVAPAIEEGTGAYTATITVPAGAIAGAAADTLEISGTVTIETSTYADLDGDGYITGNDVNEAIKYVNKQSAQGANPDYEPYVFINGITQEPISEVYGDVDGDTYITGNDVNEIIKYVNKQSPQGANPDYEPYVFPVLLQP